MELKLTQKQFRRLLDLVYIGNWVLNSTRGDDRIRDYDQVESLVFSHCLGQGMEKLTELYKTKSYFRSHKILIRSELYCFPAGKQ